MSIKIIGCKKYCQRLWKYWVAPWEIFSISIKIIGGKKYCQQVSKYLGVSMLLEILSFSLRNILHIHQNNWLQEILSTLVEILSCWLSKNRRWTERWDLGEGEVEDCVSSKKLKFKFKLDKVKVLVKQTKGK